MWPYSTIAPPPSGQWADPATGIAAMLFVLIIVAVGGGLFAAALYCLTKQ